MTKRRILEDSRDYTNRTPEIGSARERKRFIQKPCGCDGDYKCCCRNESENDPRVRELNFNHD